MLGRRLSDPEGAEFGGETAGMGLLPADTRFARRKTTVQTEATVSAGPFAGAKLLGYQIHMGRTETEAEPFCVLPDGTADGAVSGLVFGTYLHGLFDSGELTAALADWLLRRKGLEPVPVQVETHRDYQERQLDLLADTVRNSLNMAAIYRAMEEYEHG